MKPYITAPLLKQTFLIRASNKLTLEFVDDNAQAAVFERNGWYWFVFNEKNNGNIYDALKQNKKLYYQYEIIRNDKYLIFRVKADGLPTITKMGKKLEIRFVKSLANNTRTLIPIINNANVAINVFNNIHEYIEIIDPDIKDTIFVVPANISKTALKKDHKFTHFNLLNSSYGVAVNAISDQLRL